MEYEDEDGLVSINLTYTRDTAEKLHKLAKSLKMTIEEFLQTLIERGFELWEIRWKAAEEALKEHQ